MPASSPTRRFLKDHGLFLGLLLLMAAAWFTSIGRYAFVGPDEPRYARIAEEMVQSGDWVRPTLKGHPWLEKPPLLYWAQAVSYQVLGVSEFSARVPSVLAALALLAALYAALWPVYGTRMALLSSVALSSGVMFIGFAGAGTTDMIFTSCVSIGLILAWRHLSASPAPHPAGLWLAFFLFGLACLAKGPLALVMPLLTIYPFLATTAGLERIHLTGILPGMALFLAVSLPWFWLIYIREGFHFILVFFINHHLARYLTDIHHHSGPVYFYLLVILLGMLPWSPFLCFIRGIRESWRARRIHAASAGLVYFACWTVFPLLFFSLSSSKLPGYILPVFPALAVLTGWGLERYCARTGSAGAFRIALAVLILVVGIGLPVFFQVRFQLPFLGLLLALLSVPGFFLCGYWLRRGRKERAILSLVLAMILPPLLGGPWLFPALEPYFSHRRLCRLAMTWTGAHNPLLVYRNFHHTNDYYTGYTCVSKIETLEALDGHLRGRTQPAFVLTTRESVAELAHVPGWRPIVLSTAGRSALVRLVDHP